MKRFRWDKKYLYWGITAFLVIACSIVFFMSLQYVSSIRAFLGVVLRALSPIVWGLVIAYLLCPMTKLFQRKLFAPLGKRLFPNHQRRQFAVARGTAIALSLILFSCVIAALLWLVLPQLYESIQSIVVSSPQYARSLIQWVEDLLRSFPEAEAAAVQVVDRLSDTLMGWVENTILPQLDSIVTNVTTGVYSVLREILNVLIGLIVSIYVLYNKELFGAQAKKVLYCIFPTRRAESILKGISYTDRAFMGFISGQLLDSLIVAVLCYILCSLLRIPYATLVSVIVGVTNIIPFFGPFIGAVPSALIILMVSPLKALIFVIMILVIQQFDGNILSPKILGNKTGLNGFWVMFAILIGGGLFGFVGVLCGVPVFTVIYAGIRHLVSQGLKKRGLPEETADFIGLEHIDEETGQIVKRQVSPVTEAPVEAEDTPDEEESGGGGSPGAPGS